MGATHEWRVASLPFFAPGNPHVCLFVGTPSPQKTKTKVAFLFAEDPLVPSKEVLNDPFLHPKAILMR